MSDRDYTVCFYCDRPTLPSRIEQDHAPIPVRHGGIETVPACQPCHDLKDRVRLEDWPAELAAQAFKESGPLGRILLAKVYADLLDRQRADAEAEAAA